MTQNPYAAPQAVPPPDKQRWKRWLGTLLLVLGVIYTLMALSVFGHLLGFGPPRVANTSDKILMLATLINSGIAAALWFTGKWLRKKGRPSSANE